MDGTILHNRMTLDEYRAERQRLREIHGDDAKEANGRREQELALLFDRSGLTQEELAAEEGQGRQFISYRLVFGRFLNFASADASAEKLPASLTEYKFRQFWKQTDKADNDRKRFLDVLATIQSAPVVLAGRSQRNTGLTQKIVDEFADGKWHAEETIYNHFDEEDPEAVKGSLTILKKPSRGAAGARAEHEKRGSRQYIRLFKQEKMISNHEIKEKLAPLIKGLKEEGKKNMATMSPGTVAQLAALLQRHLDEWSE